MTIVHTKKWDKHLTRFHAVNMLPKYICYLFASLSFFLKRRMLLKFMSLKLHKIVSVTLKICDSRELQKVFSHAVTHRLIKTYFSF